MLGGGGIIGGAAADVDIALPWIIGAAGFALTGFAGLLLMGEPGLAPLRDRRKIGVARTAVAGLDVARTFPLVRLLCILSAAAAAGIMPAHFLWPAYLESLLTEPSFWLLGWLWALDSNQDTHLVAHGVQHANNMPCLPISSAQNQPSNF